ncbi:MAG: glycosyltransferase family 39 protein [Anaerolineales bacterium]
MPAKKIRKRAAGRSDLLKWLLPNPENLAFWLMVGAVIAVRFWDLDQQPGEVYGDISTVYLYIKDVLEGRWPFYFALSAGPLYHYLAVPVIWMAGFSYFGLKVASVLVSLGTLAFTYLFARRLAGKLFAILAGFIAGISSWLLVFSRLGNFPIVVPMLTAGMLWLLLRYVQEWQSRDLYASGAVATLGLLAYPQAYFLLPALVLTLATLHLSGLRIKREEWLRLARTCALFALPFAWMLYKAPGALTAGYLGEKLQAAGDIVAVLAGNIVHALGAYFVRGDMISRVNPLSLPHLDVISSILLIIGIAYWLGPRRRRYGLMLLIPFIVLHIPSILTLNAPDDVPSATRTLGAAPIAYVLVAGGLMQAYEWARGAASRKVAAGLAATLLAGITFLNLNNYFVHYLNNLPYQNTSVARLITEYADLLPPDTQIYLAGCCWESGMPEPLSIEQEMARPENLHAIQPEDLSCFGLDAMLAAPTVVIWSYKNDLPNPELWACAERFPGQLYTALSGLPAFQAAAVTGLPEAPSAEADGEGLLAQALDWDGERVLVRYSPADIGRIEDAVDGNLETIYRGAGANPLVMEFAFAEPRPAARLGLTLATMPMFSVRVVITYEDGTSAAIARQYTDQPSDPTIEIELRATEKLLQTLRIEITDQGLQPGDGYHIHVRDVSLE